MVALGVAGRRSLDVAKGMDSRVSVIAGPDGGQVGAGWMRTLRSTGDYVFSGCYSTRRLPGALRDSIHVAFPLEKGNVQVFLRPEVGEGGSLWLHSPLGRPSTRPFMSTSTSTTCCALTTTSGCGTRQWCGFTTGWPPARSRSQRQVK